MVLGGLQDAGQVVDAVVDGSTHLLAFSSCLRALVEGGMETERAGRERGREGRRKGGGGRMYSVHVQCTPSHLMHTCVSCTCIHTIYIHVLVSCCLATKTSKAHISKVKW